VLVDEFGQILEAPPSAGRGSGHPRNDPVLKLKRIYVEKERKLYVLMYQQLC